MKLIHGQKFRRYEIKLIIVNQLVKYIYIYILHELNIDIRISYRNISYCTNDPKLRVRDIIL